MDSNRRLSELLFTCNELRCHLRHVIAANERRAGNTEMAIVLQQAKKSLAKSDGVVFDAAANGYLKEIEA